MTTTATKHKTKFHIPFLEGVLSIKESQVPAEIIAGLTLAPHNIERMYTNHTLKVTNTRTGHRTAEC